MTVYIVGNERVYRDSIPFRLLPRLIRTFPDITIVEADPNENFIPQKGSIIVDTVEGIRQVRLFHDLDDFITTKSVSPHDYDLGFHLKLLQKLKKLPTIMILGIPSGMSVEESWPAVRRLMDKCKDECEQ